MASTLQDFLPMAGCLSSAINDCFAEPSQDAHQSVISASPKVNIELNCSISCQKVVSSQPVSSLPDPHRQWNLGKPCAPSRTLPNHPKSVFFTWFCFLVIPYAVYGNRMPRRKKKSQTNGVCNNKKSPYCAQCAAAPVRISCVCPGVAQ